jgi:FAD/FMN-containing dehydrogenase
MDANLEPALTWRGDDDYEQVRRRILWNELVPDRYPEVVVAVRSADDVIAAVRLAREEGMRIAIKGGGHSFCGSPLRDGGMLIDLAGLTELSIDAGARTAIVSPGITGREFAHALEPHGLAFPVGHCGSVPMSGYLLAGGFGWNMGMWGPAAFNVERVEVVTADGELVSADSEQNTDLFWAARGAGAGFFGVATRFHVRVHPLPQAMRTSTYIYPLSELDAVAEWASEVAPAAPPPLEVLVFVGSAPPDSPAPGAKVVGVTATAFADDEGEAQQLLSVLDGCPVVDRALVRHANEPASFDSLLDVLDAILPRDHRYAVDVIWTSEDFAGLLPGIGERIEAAPAPRSVALSVMPPPPPEDVTMPDAALSMFGRSLLMAYAIWEDAADDDANQRWLTELRDGVAESTLGYYVGEADLAADAAHCERSYAPANWERLRELKRRHDPDNVFYTYLGAEA